MNAVAGCAILAITAGIVGFMPVQTWAENRPTPVSNGDAAFAQWASKSLHRLSSLDMNAPATDLLPLRNMISNANIVMFDEGQHFATEPLAFRNRLFKYLVEELGFTAIAIESGATEGRVVHDYSLGGPGDIASALPQNKELIAWMRDYNANPKHGQKVEVFGFDSPGSPSNISASRGADTALNETLHYLQKVDAPEAEALKARLGSVLPATH